MRLGLVVVSAIPFRAHPRLALIFFLSFFFLLLHANKQFGSFNITLGEFKDARAGIYGEGGDNAKLAASTREVSLSVSELRRTPHRVSALLLASAPSPLCSVAVFMICPTRLRAFLLACLLSHILLALID